MDTKRIQELYEYNRWANERMVRAVEKLDAGQFVRDMGNSFRSVRDTLVHIMSAEWLWLSRWQGESPQAMFAAADFPTVETVKARWQEIAKNQMEFVARVTEPSLERIVSYTTTKGETVRNPLWQLMQHLVNHSTYHRGQVTTLLRQLGAEPASTDLIFYYRQKAAART